MVHRSSRLLATIRRAEGAAVGPIPQPIPSPLLLLTTPAPPPITPRLDGRSARPRVATSNDRPSTPMERRGELFHPTGEHVPIPCAMRPGCARSPRWKRSGGSRAGSPTTSTISSARGHGIRYLRGRSPMRRPAGLSLCDVPSASDRLLTSPTTSATPGAPARLRVQVPPHATEATHE